jgi:hypothetical protein
MPYLLIFLHSSPSIDLEHLYCDLMDIRWTIQELGQGGQTNLFCALAGIDSAPVNGAK